MGVLVWLGKGVWDLNDRVARLEEKAIGTKERLDRIGDRLPSLGIEIAYEAVFAPISLAVLMTKPVEVGNGMVKFNAYVFDAKAGNVQTFTKEADEKAADTIIAKIKGNHYDLDASALTVSKVEKLSVETHQSKFAPGSVVKDASFVFYQPDDKIIGILKDASMQPASAVTGKSVSNWSELSTYLGAVDWLKSGP